MARAVLVTERQIICLSKPWINSTEQYVLAMASSDFLFLLTQNVNLVVQFCNRFLSLSPLFKIERQNLTNYIQ